MRITVAAMMLAVGPVGPAAAGLEVCNDTTIRQSVAIGYEALGGVWTSEGWWQIAPGDCKRVLSDWTPRDVVYYRATGRDLPEFTGPYGFCTQSDAFTILGDKECEARGYDRSRFRAIETGGAAEVTFDLSTGQMRRAAGQSGSAPAPMDLRADFARGSLGEPFTQRGIFGGCEVIDGLDFCEFEIEGWRYHAYYGGGTADALMDGLQDWPVPLAVELEGDMIAFGDITVEVALGRVTEVPGGDPFAAIRRGLQGTWQSLDDAASRFRVRGSNVYDSYDGSFMGQQWMTLTQGCEGQGVSVGLVRMDLETRDSWCVWIDVLDGDRLELINPGRGNLLSYRRLD